MQENKGFYQLMEQLPQERLLIAVHSIAGSEAMFELTRDWVRERKAFGRRVADLQTGKRFSFCPDQSTTETQKYKS